MMMTEIKLDKSWKKHLSNEFSQDYMQQLHQFLLAEKGAGKVIFPSVSDCFSAMNLTPFDQVKVVILGQDPYHGERQAHGLCFSVPPRVALPPSLLNIYKELRNDLGYPMADHGSLVSWAMQGVLLLNSVLTVEGKQAASHQGRGWERFTDAIISEINARREHVVFILWGAYAQKKGACIDHDKHLIIKAPHPSPLSAYRGFFGGKYFSRSNEYLQGKGKRPIQWQLPKLDEAIKQFKQAQEINHNIAQGDTLAEG